MSFVSAQSKFATEFNCLAYTPLISRFTAYYQSKNADKSFYGLLSIQKLIYG